MKVINLRDIYPHYTQDCFVEVTDEVAGLFSEFGHKEAAYRLRTCRHKASMKKSCGSPLNVVCGAWKKF